MWAEWLKGHCFAWCDLRAGHRGTGAAEALSGTLSCSRGCLPNAGHAKVMGHDGRRQLSMGLGAQDPEKARKRIRLPLHPKLSGKGQKAEKPGAKAMR